MYASNWLALGWLMFGLTPEYPVHGFGRRKRSLARCQASP
jgi:hypothetical protein